MHDGEGDGNSWTWRSVELSSLHEALAELPACLCMCLRMWALYCGLYVLSHWYAGRKLKRNGVTADNKLGRWCRATAGCHGEVFQPGSTLDYTHCRGYILRIVCDPAGLLK